MFKGEKKTKKKFVLFKVWNIFFLEYLNVFFCFISCVVFDEKMDLFGIIEIWGNVKII